ncbi:hypothetical protein ACFRJ1_33975 [Streptomyces sp. NPDC056773]|uniref:hypothetical protein n=1 Tax=unclassified Streptomyces TaxID=2593676 RepID=UPI0036C200C4
MSSTTMWVVGAVPDEEARAIPGRYLHLIQPDEWSRPPAYSRESLAWWTDGGDREPFFRGLEPTPAAHRFAELMDGVNASASEAVTAARDASVSAMPAAEGPGLFLAAARKADPVAALYYGLGSEGSAMLPGWYGDFLLSAAEVAAALPRAEEALCLAGSRRSEVLARITLWTTAMGDDPGFDAAGLLDGPLRTLRFAASTGSGAAALTRRH